MFCTEHTTFENTCWKCRKDKYEPFCLKAVYNFLGVKGSKLPKEMRGAWRYVIPHSGGKAVTLVLFVSGHEPLTKRNGRRHFMRLYLLAGKGDLCPIGRVRLGGKPGRGRGGRVVTL